MAIRAVLITCLISLAGAQFVPPDAILQAGYPAGFRAFIPDFPGCEMFAFHGKINSPFTADEPGDLSNEILRPQDGFWTFQDLNVVLTPGDILHYWTMIVKDKVPYPKKNLTWKVPDPDETVDLLSPITLKPPKTKPTKSPIPEKMRDTEPTTPAEDSTTPTETNEEDTSAEPSETSSTTAKTTPQATTTTTTKAPPSTTPRKPTTTTKKPTTERPKTNKPKKSTPPMPEPQNAEEIEELTTPTLPFEKPLSGEFPEEPPLFPFPSLFPRPYPKPMMPPAGPGFEICSNPWNFEERPGESRAERLERQVAKLQCDLALFQRGTNQLANRVENELSDLKKLVYGAVARMARLENLLRSAAFG